MKPLELEVFFNNDETRALQSASLDCHITQNDIRTCTFYTVGVLTPAVEDDGYNYSNLLVDGETFSLPYTYAELKKIIENHLKYN